MHTVKKSSIAVTGLMAILICCGESPTSSYESDDDHEHEEVQSSDTSGQGTANAVLGKQAAGPGDGSEPATSGSDSTDAEDAEPYGVGYVDDDEDGEDDDEDEVETLSAEEMAHVGTWNLDAAATSALDTQVTGVMLILADTGDLTMTQVLSDGSQVETLGEFEIEDGMLEIELSDDSETYYPFTLEGGVLTLSPGEAAEQVYKLEDSAASAL